MTIKRIIHFLRQDLWRIPIGKLPRKKSFLIKQLRIIVLAFRGFDEDKCILRASALTFYSLLSVVPAVALAFGIAKGFGMQKLLEKGIIENMKGQEEVITYVITFANSMLEGTRGGLIAGIGVIVLFWLIIKLLGNIESSFNDIWGIQHPRSLGRKLSDYLAVMFIGPVLFVMSSSITVFITTQLTRITQRIELLGPVSPLILFTMKVLPYCVIWLLFTFLYIFMPNTKIRFRSGLLAGVVAGTIFVIVQWVYITFQVGVSRYGAIYGSFAVLPFFMAWLQVSWLIVLLGAEISFAYQNVDTYDFEPDSLKVSPFFKKLLALRIAHVCVKNFFNGERPWSAEQISNGLESPIRLVNKVLFELVQCRVLCETLGTDEEEVLYQPARDVDSLSINFVVQALDRLGNDEVLLEQSQEMDKISGCISEFSDMIDSSDANLLLKDI